MPYSPWDEYFIHQLPRTLDHVNDSEPNWSDRCFFHACTPDGKLMLVTVYGNHPNTQHAHGYAKLSLADGRHTIVYYVPLHPGRTQADGYSHFAWDGSDLDHLTEVESNTISVDQAMQFDYDGMVGHDIFKLFVAGSRYPRYANWGVLPARRARQVHV